ncbi:hypothetical protein N7492_005934 [Penicillium capsulatum]|uniref:histidine kinase n=1 Tax=Penicillium capsulatum TaxID=69766 RepID=A0A9W9IDC1_9EURO|nr:hypothetical protein N7492_005934 [Penicillium capsulatum]KAJ6134963.1 hypothetical protein N7512_000123 [Penicillium capsulatum]
MPPQAHDINPDDWNVIYNGQEDSEDGQLDGKTTLARTLSVPRSMCILSDTKNEISTITEIPPPKLKLPLLNDDTIERVFPVRSVVSFDSTPSSALQTPSLDKLESTVSPFVDATQTDDTLAAKLKKDPREGNLLSRPDHLSRMHQQSRDSTGTPPTLSTISYYGSNNSISVTERYAPDTSSKTARLSTQLRETIVTGGQILAADRLSKGLQYSQTEEANLLIHALGALVILSEIQGNLTVQAASDNVDQILGYAADELFELDSILTAMPDSQVPMFLSHVRYVLEDSYDVEIRGPEVFGLSLIAANGDTRQAWCTMHTSNAYKKYVICELELDLREIMTDNMQSVYGHGKYVSPSKDARQDQSTEEKKLDASTQEPNRGLKLLNVDILNALPRILRRLSSAQTLDALVHDAIHTIRQFTQFHRVTFFQFDSDKNGLVVADAVDHSRGLQSYEGVHFDETTFPDSLKEQYLHNTVSLSYRGSEISELVCRASTNKLGLDLSHCYLQAPSAAPDNIPDSSVYACVSIGIHVFGKLWGLVSCQSHQQHQRLHPVAQRVCWFMSEAVSSNIERLSYSLPFQLQEQCSELGEQDTKAPSCTLLGLFRADYAAASILEETKIIGKPTDSQEVLALLEYLRAKSLNNILWSTDLAVDFEDLEYLPGFRHISGLLYTPLSADGSDFIIFFRSYDPGDYKQDRLQRGAVWSAAELGKASILSLMYRTFTEIWQEKESAMQNNQLMRLLLANSAHEFRTPLNAIINYLEIALDGTLDQATRENLSRSHSASKSLVYIINDLLDLTNAENGKKLIKDETFSLSATLCEATDIFWEEARQKHVDLQVIQHSALPDVLGDQRRVRQVITNLISNAVQHTSAGAVTIESCILSESCDPKEIAVEVAIHDTGSGMSQDTVETLFCELEQVSNKWSNQNPKSLGKNSSHSILETESVLGLGLALVARIVRNMNGQLSLKSEEGKGSCFKIRLKFPLPPEISEPDLHSLARSNEIPSEDEVAPSTTTCNAKSASENDLEENKNTDGRTSHKENEIVYRCGEDVVPGSGPGEQNSTFLDVDVALKTGESRNITIPTYASPSERESQPKSLRSETYSDREHTKGPEYEKTKPQEPDKTNKLHILVAEDDPVNSTIIQKRLEKSGYTVRLTGNGKECAAVHREEPSSFDAVLMDLQMPIVDGQSATKMIRAQEARDSHHKRVPVFAVSASLMEKDRQGYIDCGFDGWIMKPIDFRRVHALLRGVRSSEDRDACLYQPGMWEQGGWFAG